MIDYGVITSFYHSDLDAYGGARRFPDRVASHNRYFYDVWAELVRKFVGSEVPVIVVNNASPVHADNFFAHLPSFDICENVDVRPHGTPASHYYNHCSALWRGFVELRERGVKYAGFVEQDVMIGEMGWLAGCVDRMKQRGAKLMTFELEDLKWVATELFVAEVDYWLENRLLAPEAWPDATEPTAELNLMRRLKAFGRRAFRSPDRSSDETELVEVMLMRQMRALDTGLHLTWEGMRSARDVHPDPCGVNGVRYIHHRNPSEVLSFLDHCPHDSPSVDQLRSFIRSRGLEAEAEHGATE